MNRQRKDHQQIVLKPLLSMYYTPRILTYHVKCRSKHSFLYVLEGEYAYRAPKMELTVRSGDLLYLPQGARYTYTILSTHTKCMQIEFEAGLEGGRVLLSKQPVVLHKADHTEALFREMVAQYNLHTDAGYYRALGLLYELFSLLMGQVEQVELSGSKIAPAVQYIEAHVNQNISVELLASLCYMSQSQLRRLFQKEYGMSPISYKNKFRIDRAKELLVYGAMSVGEVAYALGFDSVFAFSKMFKKQTGIPPSVFSKKKQM